MANEKRLIDANAVLQWLIDVTDRKEWLVSQYNADWIFGMIDSQPTVDAVEVVHGRWIDTPHAYGFVSPRCSVCLQFSKYHEKFNFCPNCGAKMDGDGNV